MKRTKTLFLLLVLGCLSACVSEMPSNAPAYRPAPAPQAGQANLYIYRNGAFPKERAPRVMVDGKRILDPPEGAYTVLALPPGQHNVEMIWAADVRLPTRRVSVILGDQDAQYLKITGDFDYRPTSLEDEVRVDMTAGILRFPLMYTWLVEMPRDAAESEMRDCCRYLAPEKH